MTAPAASSSQTLDMDISAAIGAGTSISSRSTSSSGYASVDDLSPLSPAATVHVDVETLSMAGSPPAAPRSFAQVQAVPPCPLQMRSPTNPKDKTYYCQRCLNHGEMHPRKGHKPFCRYGDCACDLCRLVDRRRLLNNSINRVSAQASDPSAIAAAGASGGAVGDKEVMRTPDGGRIRKPLCARCQVHGSQEMLRGHKKRCPYNQCHCDGCALVSERRVLMSRQIKVRREQRNEINRLRQMDERMRKLALWHQQEQQLVARGGPLSMPPPPPPPPVSMPMEGINEMMSSPPKLTPEVPKALHPAVSQKSNEGLSGVPCISTEAVRPTGLLPKLPLSEVLGSAAADLTGQRSGFVPPAIPSVSRIGPTCPTVSMSMPLLQQMHHLHAGAPLRAPFDMSMLLGGGGGGGPSGPHHHHHHHHPGLPMPGSLEDWILRRQLQHHQHHHPHPPPPPPHSMFNDAYWKFALANSS